jgi:hypothetical protein
LWDITKTQQFGGSLFDGCCVQHTFSGEECMNIRHATQVSALAASLVFLFGATALGQSNPGTSTSDLSALQNQQQQLTLQQQIQQLTQQINSASGNQNVQNQKDALSLQKDIGDLKLSIAQDKVNSAKAVIGAINTSGLPTGQTQLTNVDIQPTITAYEESRKAVRTILAELYSGAACGSQPCYQKLDGTQVSLNCPTKLVLWSPVLSDVAVFNYFDSSVVTAIGILNGTTKPTYTTRNAVLPHFAPAVAFAAIDAVTALSSMFKVDVTMTGVTVNGDEDALRLLLLSELRKSCVNTEDIEINNFNPDIANTTILTHLKSLDDAARKTQDIANQVLSEDVTKFQGEMKKLQAKQDQLDALKKKKSELELKKATSAKEADRTELQREIQNVQLLINAALPPASGGAPPDLDYLDDINNLQINIAQGTTFASAVGAQLTKVAALQDSLAKPDSNGVPLIVRLARAEALASRISGSPTLLLSVVKAGGNNVVKRYAFWTSVKFGGGAVLKYELRDQDGLKILNSGNVSVYAYRKESDHFGDVE